MMALMGCPGRIIFNIMESSLFGVATEDYESEWIYKSTRGS